MINELLDILKEKYPLKPLDTGEFAVLKASGMKFAVLAYRAEGLGHVSVMRAKGFFGLMQMDTLMVVPEERDLPLYSYDRIHAMGNDTLITELYDTCLSPFDGSELAVTKDVFSSIADRDPGVHWYDDIKLPESLSKKGKKADSEVMDILTKLHFEAYLAAPAAEIAADDRAAKAEKSAAYVNGLLTQGGPSTDVFKKKLGEEKTAKLFKTVLFGTER